MTKSNLMYKCELVFRSSFRRLKVPVRLPQYLRQLQQVYLFFAVISSDDLYKTFNLDLNTSKIFWTFNRVTQFVFITELDVREEYYFNYHIPICSQTSRNHQN